MGCPCGCANSTVSIRGIQTISVRSASESISLDYRLLERKFDSGFEFKKANYFFTHPIQPEIRRRVVLRFGKDQFSAKSNVGQDGGQLQKEKDQLSKVPELHRLGPDVEMKQID